MKRCPMCKTTKPLAAFGRNKRRHDGVSVYCLPCKRAEQVTRWRSNPDHYNATGRRSRLKQRYGLTPEQVAAMIEERSNTCDICGRAPRVKLHIDHDHETGRLRGMLCSECNRALGLLGDNAVCIQRALDYLLATELVLTQRA